MFFRGSWADFSRTGRKLEKEGSTRRVTAKPYNYLSRTPLWSGCCDCGVHYEIGERYFVTAFRIEDRLKTSICTTEDLSAVKFFEKRFGKGNAPQSSEKP